MIEKLKTIENLDISEEKLDKEISESAIVMKEILMKQETESLRSLVTNPSAVALETTKHEAGFGINAVKKKVKDLFVLYLTNQFVARAINVRADTLISGGYTVEGEDQNGIKACEELIHNSGGVNCFWQLSVNTDIAGDGFQEKIYNQKKTKITRLKQVHPLTLEYKKNKDSDRIIIDSKTKEPVGYVQYYLDKDGVEVEKDVPKDRISHFKYNSLGDEFTGMSAIQPGYDTIVRLMNMEYSAAEAAVKTANPLWVGKTNTKSPHQIAQWATILGKINGKDQIFIPEGMELEMKSPGPQNFNEYADYFLNAVVACFGVPKSVLLGGSDSSGNRAQDVVLSKHFYNLIQANQRYMEQYFNGIFEEYADIAGFKAPKLVFEDIAEDANLLAESAIKLIEAGIIDRNEARAMIGLSANKEAPDIKQSMSDAVKKSNMEAWHPAEAGSPSGSQAGEKKAMKNSPDSIVPSTTK